MNKRDLVLSLLDRNKKAEYIPAAFFFCILIKSIIEGRQRRQASGIFSYTGMDFVKKSNLSINFPFKPERPDDWVRMPLYKKDFLQG